MFRLFFSKHTLLLKNNFLETSGFLNFALDYSKNIMNIVLDIHTHTVASGHAFSTLQEMAQAAADKGIQLLGITEHGPGIPGTIDPIYFRNLWTVPRQMYGVQLMLGSELNILDFEGHLDLDESYLKRMDICIAGLHSLCYTPGTVEQNTSAVIGAIKNPYVKVISHPGDGTAELNYKPIVLAAKENHTLLEINNSSLDPYREKEAAPDNFREILRLCKKYNQPIILGSDAHISFAIAKYDLIYPLLAETEFPEALILNDKLETFKAYIAQ